MPNKDITAFFYDEKGNKVRFSSQELFIELNNGQVLTLATAHNNEGIAISDHSTITADQKPEKFAVLSIKPSACNVIVIDSHLQKIKDSSAENHKG